MSAHVLSSPSAYRYCFPDWGGAEGEKRALSYTYFTYTVNEVENRRESDVWDSMNLNCVLFLPFKINMLKLWATCVN